MRTAIKNRVNITIMFARIFRAGFVLIVGWAWSVLRNRGPGSELSANFLVQSESGAAAFLARFWPVLVRVRVRVRVKVYGLGWVYARTLMASER